MTCARGESSLREAKKDTQKESTNTEVGAATTGLVCNDPAQVNLIMLGGATDQHWVTHGPTTGPSTEEPGDPKEMDLN